MIKNFDYLRRAQSFLSLVFLLLFYVFFPFCAHVFERNLMHQKYQNKINLALGVATGKPKI